MDIEATGFVCMDFRRNDDVVHVRLDYEVYETPCGYHIEFVNIGTRDPSLVMRLKNPEIRTKILSFIIGQITGKMPATAELTFPI